MVGGGPAGTAHPISPVDFWDGRYTSPAPWERADVSTHDGAKFAQIIAEKARHPETWDMKPR
jgi:hypothetical protein